MTVRFGALVCAGAALWLSAAAPGDEPSAGTRLDGVAACVNGHFITLADVLTAVGPSRRRLQRDCQGAELERRLRAACEEAVELLVERRLIIDAYDAQQERRIPDWLIEQRMQEIVREQFDGDQSALLRALDEEGLGYERWKEEVGNQLAISMMRAVRVEQLVRIGPGEARRFYERGKEGYERPAKVRLRMIVLANQGTASMQQADDIRARVMGGEDFGVVAKAVSRGSHAASGGDWGWIEPKILRPELAAAARDLPPGGVSEVVRTDEDLYLLKIEGRQNPAPVPFEEVRAEIERGLRQAEAQRLHRAWIADLKSRSGVTIRELPAVR